jgi:ribosomal-protein-alanine N-acetyltransferase
MPLINLGMGHRDAIASLEAGLFARPFTVASLASLFAGKAFAGYALTDNDSDDNVENLGGNLSGDHGGNIISYILLSQVLDEAEILSLGTAPDHQGKGHARRLLTETCETLIHTGICKMYLDVAASNVAARALYSGCGFEESGRRAGYYGTAPHRQDAIIMSKALI